MVKLTLITKVDENTECLEKNINTVFKSPEDIDLICIGNEFDKTIFNNNNKITIIDSLNNNLLNTLDSEYILFVDSNKKINENVLNSLVTKLETDLVDILMFILNNQSVEDMTIISRITGNTTFTHEKIKDFIFNIDDTIFSKIYKKDFLNNFFNEVDIENTELINIKLLLNAKDISVVNEVLYEEKQEYFEYINTDDYKKYIDSQKNILNFLNETIYISVSKNNFIHKLCDKFEEVGIEYKKESFYLLRNTFLEILENNDKNNFMNSLSNTNRKKFEQIIISESLEEYDLLKKLSEDTKSINYMKRYGKILKSEEEKIKNFNNSLTSSNSWKLTKIFRLIRIKWF